MSNSPINSWKRTASAWGSMPKKGEVVFAESNKSVAANSAPITISPDDVPKASPFGILTLFVFALGLPATALALFQYAT